MSSDEVEQIHGFFVVWCNLIITYRKVLKE